MTVTTVVVPPLLDPHATSAAAATTSIDMTNARVILMALFPGLVSRRICSVLLSRRQQQAWLVTRMDTATCSNTLGYMSLQLEHLDDLTRQFMVSELDHDEGPPDRVYISSRLSGHGEVRYRGILREALTDGSTGSLESALSQPGILNATESYLRKGRPVTAKMKSNAAQIMAEGQFNRYYIRGLCARVLDVGAGEVQVYRARPSQRPRPESQRMIGMLLDPALLLDDLRLHVGEEPTMLPYVNSGLSVRIA